MSAPATIPTPCPELGLEVPFAEIGTTLHRLWQENEAYTNASLINLVVFSERPGSLLDNSAIVRELTREHACRAILAEIDRSIPEPSLRAWITAHCHLSNGRQWSCCEQIAFHLTGKVTGRFRNTIFSHLNSDLPLVFWWQGELSDLFSERLVVAIDRLIFDSACWRDPAASFEQIATTSAVNTDLILHDLAWSRTWQMRMSVANLFDDAVAAQALNDIERVVLRHHPAHRMSALQLLAWIAVQAQWQDLPSPSGFAFLSGRQQRIEVSLQADANAPSVAELSFHAGDFSAKISRRADSNHLERAIEATGYRVNSICPVGSDEPGELVAELLARGGANTLFSKILPRLRTLLDHPAARA